MNDRDLHIHAGSVNAAHSRRGIPTEYKGINFRSRLEATWAAFFDLCKWSWEYEPFDLEGYVPDFLLRGATPFLVDVRPLTHVRQYHERAAFVGTPCEGHEILIVGAGLIACESFGGLSLGIMSESVCPEENGGLHWYELSRDAGGPSAGRSFDHAVLMTCGKCGVRSFFHEMMSWHSRICGHQDGDHYIGNFDAAPALWAQAKNVVQWNAVTPKTRTT